VSYSPLNRTINIERKNESISAYISRYTLFDPVKVSISLHSKKRAKYSRILLDIEGISKRIVLNKRTPGEYLINNVPASVTFENINIIEDTINRLLAGDFSVIDEVEQRNQTIVESLTKQLQEQKIEYFNDVPEEIEPVEVNVDVLDFMPDEQRQKLITYLVASKLKSSEGD
jgi:restriction endonuclease Mrr